MAIPANFPNFFSVIRPKFDPGTVMYLTVPSGILREITELKVRSSERFFNMVEGLVVKYMTEGKRPPSAIAGAIMNLGDDIAAGRTPVIRAGDYIALTEYARQQKIL
jgi:hypothetical protein